MEKWTAKDMPDQSGRVVIITGANSGLGYESSLAFARKGARVIMACRSMERGQAALDKVKQQVPDADVVLMALDLGDLASVRAFVEAFKAAYDRLDVLLNNAGVMAIPERRETADGFEMQIGVNHLGHFALTGWLLDVLAQSAAPRVVNVSSGAHNMGEIRVDDLNFASDYSPYGAYSQSKLANVLFTHEMQRRADAAGFNVVCVTAHPGYSATNLQQTGGSFDEVIYKITNAVMAQSAEMGALPQLYAATAPDVRGGDFYGPHFLGLRGYPEKRQPNAKANDAAVAAKLWERSEALTGVTYDFVVAETV